MILDSPTAATSRRSYRLPTTRPHSAGSAGHLLARARHGALASALPGVLIAALIGTLTGTLISSALPALALAGPAEAGAQLEQLYQPALLDGEEFDPAVPRPADILGYPVGSRAATHGEIVRVFEALAAASPRAELRQHGATHEHRRLIHLIVSSEETMGQLDSVHGRLMQLADPRGVTGAEARQLIHDLPVVCWMGYSIHGDELSGADAAMLVAYRMVLGQPRQEDLVNFLSRRLEEEKGQGMFKDWRIDLSPR